MRQVISFDKDDYGIVILCTLKFTDFDPTGSTAVLEVRGDSDRAMTLDGVVASYTVQAPPDFTVGFHVAQVRVTKGAVSISSERFAIKVRD